MFRKAGFTKDEMLAGGFEAHCIDADGVRYLWHEGYGLRVDERRQRSTLLLDADSLPEGPWSATDLGLRELEAQLGAAG